MKKALAVVMTAVLAAGMTISAFAGEDLADKKIAAYWELLLGASEEKIASICSALEQAGEQEMAKAFRFLMANYREKPEKIKDFVEGNSRYIRGKMIGYVKKNIELFY